MAGNQKSKYSRRTPAEWGALMARFGASKLGVEAFCRHEAISSANFYRWRNLLNKEIDGSNKAVHDTAPVFIDVGRLDSASSPGPKIDLKLDLGDGLILHLVRS